MSTHTANSLGPEEQQFLARRQRAACWWPAWLVLCIGCVIAAAAYIAQAEPAVLAPLAHITQIAGGDASTAELLRLATLTPIVIYSLFLALIGGILMGVARRVNERRLLGIVTRLSDPQ